MPTLWRQKTKSGLRACQTRSAVSNMSGACEGIENVRAIPDPLTHSRFLPDKLIGERFRHIHVGRQQAAFAQENVGLAPVRFVAEPQSLGLGCVALPVIERRLEHGALQVLR